MITIKNTLAEVVRDYPQSIPFFNELHLDYCCGGGIPLEEAVKGTNLDAEKVVANLNDYLAKHSTKTGSQQESLERFKSLSIPDMLQDLEATHHVSERNYMAEIEGDLNKILLVHYAHHGELLPAPSSVRDVENGFGRTFCPGRKIGVSADAGISPARSGHPDSGSGPGRRSYGSREYHQGNRRIDRSFYRAG